MNRNKLILANIILGAFFIMAILLLLSINAVGDIYDFKKCFNLFKIFLILAFVFGFFTTLAIGYLFNSIKTANWVRRLILALIHAIFTFTAGTTAVTLLIALSGAKGILHGMGMVGVTLYIGFPIALLFGAIPTLFIAMVNCFLFNLVDTETRHL